ncbi:MAG: hypothetical protein MK111_18885, partial [Crocosphaera sp.]|nr:hypothetical protein [Crocosphaera sp.]
WRGVTDQQIQETFETHYKPLLEKAVDAQASFVVGDAKGTDKLVINYLKERGYELTQQDNYLSAKVQLNINTLEPKNDKSALNSNLTDISNNKSSSNPSLNIKKITQIPTIDFVDNSPIRPNYAVLCEEKEDFVWGIGENNDREETLNTIIIASDPRQIKDCLNSLENGNIPYTFFDDTLNVLDTGYVEIATPLISDEQVNKLKEVFDLTNINILPPNLSTGEAIEGYATNNSSDLEQQTLDNYNEWRRQLPTPSYSISERDYQDYLNSKIDVNTLNQVNTQKLSLENKTKSSSSVDSKATDLNNKKQEDSLSIDNSDNISIEETSPLISIDDIPSDLEIDVSTEQQLKTDLVAPIAAQFLKVQDQSNSPTRHFQGKEITIDYDGHHLTIKNNQDNSIKMKARFIGVNPATKKSQWLSELPKNAPGLKDADVQKWTSEAVKNYIKQKQVEQATQKGLNMVK